MAVDVPMEPHCTPDQCDEAISYLMAGFGPWYDDQEKRQLRRLFLDYSPQEVTVAIDQLCRQWDHGGKPRTADVGAVLRSNRRFLKSQQETKADPEYTKVEPTEDTLLHELVAAAKAGNVERIEQLTKGTE